MGGGETGETRDSSEDARPFRLVYASANSRKSSPTGWKEMMDTQGSSDFHKHVVAHMHLHAYSPHTHMRIYTD